MITNVDYFGTGSDVRNFVLTNDGTVTVGGKSATFQVTVTNKTVPVSSVSLNKTSETIYLNSSTTLIATVLPSNATNKTYITIAIINILLNLLLFI